MAKKTVSVCPKNPVFIIDETGGIIAEQESNGKLKLYGSFSIDDLATCLQKEKPLSSGIIPKGIKSFTRYSNSLGESIYRLLIEFEPNVYTIHLQVFDNHTEEYRSICLDLQLPYVYFIMEVADNAARTILSSRVFCSPVEIDSSKSPIYALPISNIYSDGKICWGSDFPNMENSKGDIKKYAVKVANEFWKIPFNFDLFPSRDYHPREIRDIELTDKDYELIDSFGLSDDEDRDYGSMLAFYLKLQKIGKDDPDYYKKIKWISVGNLDYYGAI